MQLAKEEDLKKFEKKNKKWQASRAFSLFFLVILLLAVVAVAYGSLTFMHRADAGVALGHAKSVRLALKVTAQDCYSKDLSFCDSSSEGGVTKGIYEEVISLSAAPGDFWVLKTSDNGYSVEEFVYREDDFTVWYQAEPKSYTVYFNNTMIDSK